MGEIEPMLLTETWDKSILDDTTKWFQIKENGIRAILHIKDGKIVGIRNRSNHPVLYCFPELKNASFPYNVAILDCEIVCFRNIYIDAETGKELTNEELKYYKVLSFKEYMEEYNEMPNMLKGTQQIEK